MTARPFIAFALATTVLGCSEAGLDNAAKQYSPSANGTEFASGTLRLDVFPGTTIDADGEVRALPQTLRDVEATSSGVVDVGTISLQAPGRISGVVTADQVTPWADSAQVPSSDGPVPATVHIELPGTIQTYTTRTDEQGFYEAVVVPSPERYQVAIIPDDPVIPFSLRESSFRTQSVVDVHLDYGVTLYGRVLTGAGDPVPDVRVRAIREDGHESEETHTDPSGWYVLRVEEGSSYQVVSSGRDHGRDPVLFSPQVQAQPDLGARVDFDYPSLGGPFATGRLVDQDGFGVPDAKVRFIATELDGYGPDGWELEIEDTTDANGNFGTGLVDGAYTVQFLPASAPDPSLGHGSVEITDLHTSSDDLNLGNQTLPNLAAVSGEVMDPLGNAVGGAQVTCSEIAVGSRSWSAFTKPNGDFDLDVPPAPLRCQIQPPGALAAELAWTTEVIDASIDDGHRFELREGTLVRGRVALGNAGEPFSLVEVYDSAGALLGTSLTTDESKDTEAGEFVLRVDIPE